MTDIENNIKSSRNIKQNSLNTYLSALRILKKRIEPDEQHSTLKNTLFLNNFDIVMKAINIEKQITSKKNKLTAILVALNSDNPKNQPLIDKYNKELKNLNDEYLLFLKSQTKTETQKNNWLSYEELIRIINNIMTEIKILGITKKEDLTKKEFDLLQQLLILRTYISFPLRNDFADMKVIHIKDFINMEENLRDEKNYIVINTNNKKQFHINQFKNKKFIGSKVLEIPAKLNRIINLWLKHNKSGYYLVMTDKKTPMNPNLITKFLNKIFMKYTNKKISSSMIRHIVISHLLKNEPTIKEKEEKEKAIENTFLHSQKLNDLYRKIDS